MLNRNTKIHGLTSIDELIEFLWLRPTRTGLNVDIFVDDGGSYIRNNHPLLLFARNGYDKSVSEFIPITISDEPDILQPKTSINDCDVESIKSFIVRNLEALKNLANRKISHEEFISSLLVSF